MRYAQIREIDIANGPGIRVSLYVQGCHRHCPFCFNEETWDFQGGQPYTSKETQTLLNLLDKAHIAGLTILGGEPLDKENRKEVAHLAHLVKQTFPHQSIWLYSSYLYEEIQKFDEPILDDIDVLVDGPFINERKDLTLKFRGSSNQRIIDVKESQKQNTIVTLNI